MIDLAFQALSDTAREAVVLLYSPGTDTFFEDLTRNADRVFYFDEGLSGVNPIGLRIDYSEPNLRISFLRSIWPW